SSKTETAATRECRTWNQVVMSPLVYVRFGQKRTSSVSFRMSVLGHNVYRPVQQCGAPRCSQLSQLSQQLIRRHVERVLAQDAANNRKGVGAQNLHQKVGTKSGAVI